MGDYGLVNELIKFIWKYTHLDIFLTYILQGKNIINPTKNDLGKDFWK
jgi:hypothetical protein